MVGYNWRMVLSVNQEVILRVDRLSFGGRGVARLNGLDVFVDDAAPGDVVRARLTKTKRTYAEAALIALEDASPVRVTPRCPHFGICGGCQWQHVDYRAQAQAKEAIVEERLQQLGGLSHLSVRPIIAMDDPWEFRNKMEFSFQPPDRVGLHRRGRWDEVVDLQACFLPAGRTVEILRAVREFARRHGLPCYDTRTHQGFLRHLLVREGRATGEVMVALVTAPGPFPQARDLVDALVRLQPEITSIMWAINASRGDAVEVGGFQVLHGRPFIYERLRGLTFKVGLLTFFQTNTAQAERMIDVVHDFAGLTGVERVVDLYCGVGTFALALAEHAAQVVGIEAVPASVEAARENASLNGVTNVVFHAAGASHLDQVAAGIQPEVLVLDPPRAGAGARVMRGVGRLAPRRVVYVSCNPTTLAPDLRELRAWGYEIQAAQPIDLFPQTYHVECVVQLERTAAA